MAHKLNLHGGADQVDDLCESVAHLNLKNGTDDPSRPSDKNHVNDMSGNKALMNCYLTAVVGNSSQYNKKGVKQFATDFGITVTNGKDLSEIAPIYTNLGPDEGYKHVLAFKDRETFREFINSECEKREPKKYLFIHYLSPDESRKMHQYFDVYISGHVLSLKTRQTNNNQWMYLFIDYQKKPEDRVRARNRLPDNAFPPFYVFEKIKY